MTNVYKGPSLDKDLDKITFLGEAAESLGRRLVAPGLAVVFVALCAVGALFMFGFASDAYVIVIAAAIGAYMALTIGANDVANNVGPAVGARAMSLVFALLLAAVFESAGALLAGGDVVNTISGRIFALEDVHEPPAFISAMMASLFAAAVWIHVATWLGAPVSTTHSIVGGVIGAGLAAGGIAAVNWLVVVGITAGWVLSPLLGAVIAALFLSFINSFVIYQDDKLKAAHFWLPILLGLLVAAFSGYLMLKGFRRMIEIPVPVSAVLSISCGLVVWGVYRRTVALQTSGLTNTTRSLRGLFTVPLIFSAALLSFAHGANDVANAVGPLAAIVEVHELHLDLINVPDFFGADHVTPFWVSAVGAFGISIGLLLYGPRLIGVVGRRITKLNPIRAFCIALSAAMTVLLASGLGLPVSTTHVVVGAVFGVGFFREWYRNRYVLKSGDRSARRYIRNREEVLRRKLVRRSHLVTIVGAWTITGPVSGLLAVGFYYLLRLAAG